MSRRRTRSRRYGGALDVLKGSKTLLIALGVGLVLLAGPSIADAAATISGSKITNRSAATGVSPEMQHLLDLWEAQGWFTISIGVPFAGFPGGGLRTAADAGGQQAACEGGLSNACTLATTPHGRGGALDIWPQGFNPLLTFDAQPGMLDLMTQFGQWAQSQGYTWGGSWATPDYPHVEEKDWPSLPYPPPNYASA